MFKEAEQMEQEDLHRQNAEVERKRIQKLLDLAGHEEASWRLVESLLEKKQARPYDEATQLLADLRDLAVYQNRLLKFQERFSAFREKYRSRPILMKG